ncbi:MAG TPA: hypothetical protein QGE93_02850 [Acidobacteriota bacterium]|jgi:hypothetical protein|nr:hypothetical protein [Acidobacteriota bacterium]MCS5703689.1 hypothetical protein [Acidobacteriota bacterium]MED5559147.1 hypothetical protein [Acidobacteriota bacterium]MEE2649148.1 hypothetical protein [Acidobacteriota bacterium]MEE3151211.1 hypothetical protein [Acidobacteriota bacterium]|tara:strand:- start:502 stop:807 length:306 start_codon:yes stop_codon:yes gene_type:complete
MLDPNVDYAERLLWAAVIKRAIDDYRTVIRYRSQSDLSKSEEQRLSKIYSHGSDPEKWIFGDDSGFEDICRYVGLNPAHARANLRRRSTQSEAKPADRLLS